MTVLFVVVGSGVAVTVPSEWSNAQGSSPSAPGTYQLTLPESDRRYTLVIPKAYTGQESVPLVMALHYGGQVTPFYGRGLLEQLIEPALSDLDAIIVAPDNVSGSWATQEAEQHVLELLDYIEANYNVDPGRTLLTGYSMGAMGTWYLAPRHPEVFEAALPMAGRPQADSTSLDWRTPMYAINSTADELIEIAPVESAIEQLQAKNAPVELVVVDRITHFQIPSYRPHLRAALPWIRQAWQR